jgi:predicted lipid carrier protein YhbT
VEDVVAEIVALRRQGFHYVLLADDNFYPVTFSDIRMAERKLDPTTAFMMGKIKIEGDMGVAMKLGRLFG